MRKVRVAPKGMGLNDFVAQEEGFFEAEGIEVEFDIKTFRGTQSSWKGLDYKSRPQDKPYAEGDKNLIQCACVWGSISNASAGMGRFVPDCYGVSPWAIFVRPDSRIRKPAGSQGRAGFRRHARRQPLQRAVPPGEIPAAGKHQGGQQRRLRRAPARAARQGSRGREPAAAADRHGAPARPAHGDGGRVPYPVVGARDRGQGRRARLPEWLAEG